MVGQSPPTTISGHMLDFSRRGRVSTRTAVTASMRRLTPMTYAECSVAAASGSRWPPAVSWFSSSCWSAAVSGHAWVVPGRVAANLGTAWHTVNDAVLAAGQQLLIDDPGRLHGVRVSAWTNTAGVTRAGATSSSR